MWKTALSSASFGLVPFLLRCSIRGGAHGLGVQEPRMEDTTPRAIEISPGNRRQHFRPMPAGST